MVNIRSNRRVHCGGASAPIGIAAPLQPHNRLVTLTRQVLEARGFRGFVPFSFLATQLLPLDGGIYVVIRAYGTAPTFLAASTAGWRKGVNPAVRMEQLAAK